MALFSVAVQGTLIPTVARKLDLIDDEEPTMMSIYLKSSDVYYVGKYCYREENGLDSWIALINYCCASGRNNKIIYNPQKENKKSTVMIMMAN